MRPDDNEQNAEQCLCPGCPTYDDCMDGNSETLYCGRGETDCSPVRQACICPDCPVWADYRLSEQYYCLHGAAE